jgi:AraC-like DNA-binding protein
MKRVWNAAYEAARFRITQIGATPPKPAGRDDDRFPWDVAETYLLPGVPRELNRHELIDPAYDEAGKHPGRLWVLRSLGQLFMADWLRVEVRVDGLWRPVLEEDSAPDYVSRKDEAIRLSLRENYTYKQIAQRLGRSERQVQRYINGK